MGVYVKGLVAGAVLALANGAAHSEPMDDSGSLEPAHYSAEVTGAVSAAAVGLNAANGDETVSDDQVKQGEVSERLIFTYDTYYKPDNDSGGPYELTMILGSDYASIEGAESAQAAIGLHFNEGIKPGTYDIKDGFVDVGPNSVPVSVFVVASSAERERPLVFSWDVTGTLTLESINREQATGHFEFTAYGMNRKGQVTDQSVSAKGAFHSVPYTPQASLPSDLR